MEETENIIRILEETIRAIESGNYSEISNLSNQTINTASLTQDPDNISVAVVVYSLSKILEDPKYKNLINWEKNYKNIIVALKHSIGDLKKRNFQGFRKDFEKISKILGQLSGKLKEHLREVFRRAKINKASKIYEHGISMEQTARLLGITMFELADYAGTKSEISATPEAKTLDPKSRIKLAMEIFE